MTAEKAEMKSSPPKIGRKVIATIEGRAEVDVNEDGTTAAAATAVAMGLRGVPSPTALFRAERPLLFRIRAGAPGACCFWAGWCYLRADGSGNPSIGQGRRFAARRRTGASRGGRSRRCTPEPIEA